LDEFIPSAAAAANAGNKSIDGKTAVRLDLSLNNCVLAIFGESHASNVVTSAYTPSNSGVLNFNIYNGGTYSAVDPLLGCSNAASPLGPGNAYTRLGDAIQGTGKFNKTVLVPAGIGGTTISQWKVDSFKRIATSFARLSAVGLTATGVLLHIWSNDKQLGTSQADFATDLAILIARLRTHYAGPIFIAKSTMFGNAVASGIQAAQTGAIDHPNGIWSLGDMDSLTGGTNRQADGTHLNDTGAASWASLMLSALQAYGAPFV
jgi:lysophospholipase L1-like esterase